MAIKIIQHKQTPKELAYHFKCNCGCEFWSDSEGVSVAKALNVTLFYQTKCPECGCTVSMMPDLVGNVVPRNEIFDE